MLIPSRHSPPLTSSHVFIVDDHPIVRSGVRGIIDATEQFEVVAVAGDGMEAIERIGEVNADIVVMDLSMPNIGGIEAIKELKRRRPDVEIMVFTLHQSVHRCREAVRAGARAYVCKSETDHLLPALEATARHEAYFSPFVREDLDQQVGDELWTRQQLTHREQEIVKMVANGNSNKLIARRLGISTKTVETHRGSAMRKCGTGTAAALTLYAARNGIVDL